MGGIGGIGGNGGIGGSGGRGGIGGSGGGTWWGGVKTMRGAGKTTKGGERTGRGRGGGDGEGLWGHYLDSMRSKGEALCVAATLTAALARQCRDTKRDSKETIGTHLNPYFTPINHLLPHL
jgi:hypothetical protein